MNENPHRYSGLFGGAKPGSGRKPGQLAETTYKKIALARLKAAVNSNDMPVGISILACGLYLLAIKSN
ncbi:MAG: hypothetical protein IPN42_04840 [Methylococcaceae bacterium]|nr:hypothetical protein [Methylococcaceae bacterium]